MHTGKRPPSSEPPCPRSPAAPARRAAAAESTSAPAPGVDPDVEMQDLAGNAAVADQLHTRYSGIEGESQDQDHDEWIDLDERKKKKKKKRKK